MPRYQVTIQKSLGTEFWTNDYYVEADDLGNAEFSARNIAAAEIEVHTEAVQFGLMRIRTTLVGDDVYRNVNLAIAGVRPAGEYLPLFNVFTANLLPPEGRPSVKYLRGPVLKTDMVDGVLVNAFITGPAADYRERLLLTEGLVDVDGQPILDVVFKRQVGMRQLRRGSKRKLEPVIPEDGPQLRRAARRNQIRLP